MTPNMNNQRNNDGYGIGMVITIIVLIVLIILFFTYVLPSLRNQEAPANTSSADVNLILPITSTSSPSGSIVY